MAWIKLDDQWMDHPKIIRAGRDARDMWLASITWCAKHLTDGIFPSELLPCLAVMAGVDVANCQTFARTLLDVCLWEARENAYCIHDYLDYNPPKEQVEANRIARSEAGAAGGRAKASKFKQNPGKTSSKKLAKSWQNSAPSPSPSPSQNQEINDLEFLPRFLSITKLGVESIDVLNELEDMEKQYPLIFWHVLEWASKLDPIPSNAKRYMKILGTALPKWQSDNNNGHKIDKVYFDPDGNPIKASEL
jgi:hypothetical protein